MLSIVYGYQCNHRLNRSFMCMCMCASYVPIVCTTVMSGSCVVCHPIACSAVVSTRWVVGVLWEQEDSMEGGYPSFEFPFLSSTELVSK